MALTSLIFATFTDPQAMTGLLAVFLPLFGFVNGYIASVHYRFFKGSSWVRLSLNSALFLPLFLTLAYFAVVMLDNKVGTKLLGDSGLSLVTLIYLWGCMNIPSTALGAFGGFLREEIKIPTKANRVRRMVPDQPNFLKYKLLMLALAALPVIAIEEQFTKLTHSIISTILERQDFPFESDE